MAKVKISEFNSNPALNTDIDSINIAEGCSPSGINDAIRELMAQLKDWQSGTSNDPYVVGSSGSLTLNQGTANGVPYLNGSKVVTSGSALTFNGSTFYADSNLSLSGAGTGSRYVALLNETNTYAGSLNLQAGGGSAGFGGGVTMYGANHSQYAGSVWIGYSSSTTNGIIFGQGGNGVGTEQMRLTGTGLGIGTSSPACKLEVASSGQTLRISGAGTGTQYQTFNTTGGNYYLGVSSSTGSGLISGASAYSMCLVTESARDICFGTNNSERARIDSSGNLLVGTTSAWSSTVHLQIKGASGAAVASFEQAGSSGDNIYIRNSNGVVGSITTSGSVTSYNVTSDQRLKQNIADADSASTLIDALQVRKFDWKSDNSHQRYGFVAQELLIVAPEAVNQPEDTEAMMAVDYSKLVPMLVKEVQSLRQRLSAAGL